MSVSNEFTIEAYGFTHSLRTFLTCATHDAIMMGGRGQGLKGYIEDDARMTPEIRKTVNCSTKDDKITVNRDREQIDTNMVPCNTAHELVHGVKSMDHNASQELKFMGIPGNSLLPYKVVV